MAAPFRYRHRVSYAECTVGNHVYYARYLDILERARGEFFRAAGVPLVALQAEQLIFPVVEARLHYEAAARYDDELIIEVVVTELDRLHISFTYGVSNTRNTIILTGQTRHICAGPDEKPRRMPPELFQELNAAFTKLPAPRPATTTTRSPKGPYFSV